MALEGGRCPRCDTAYWPFRYACRRDATPLERAELSSRGALYSWTTVRIAPAGFDPPYTLGFVELDDGPRVLARLAVESTEALVIGMPMELAFDLDGEAGLRAWPAEPAAAAELRSSGAGD